MKPGTPAAIITESRALLVLAWPMVIAQLAQIGTGVVDTIMAGHYSATALAAIAIGYNIWLPLYLFFIGVSLGATYIIALLGLGLGLLWGCFDGKNRCLHDRLSGTRVMRILPY